MTTEKDDHGESQAKAQYESICEMVAALECDYDRLEDLRQESKDFENEHGYQSTNAALAELEEAATDCKDQDEARERIREDPISVEVRTNWHAIGADDQESTHFRILLMTGGPAVQIMGELTEDGEPERAWLEYQDWGTSWTRYFDADQDTLLAYARCFYFGE